MSMYTQKMFDNPGIKNQSSSVHKSAECISQRLFRKTAGFLILGLILLSSCASYDAEPTLISYSYFATDRLVENINNLANQKHTPLTKGQTILVTSFVELGQLQKTSDLGRILAEQVASRINQKGYATVEVKLAQEIFIKESKGEFALSRSLTNISHQHAAQAIVVGTYSTLNNYVYVNVKIVHANDGYVYASHDFAIPKTIVSHRSGKGVKTDDM